MNTQTSETNLKMRLMLEQPQPALTRRAGFAPWTGITQVFAPVVSGVPYDVDQRPLPLNDHIDTLAPQQVGAFQRGKVLTVDAEPGARRHYVLYGKAASQSPSFVIGIFVHPDATSAQRALLGQAHAPATRQRLHSDPSFYWVRDGNVDAEFYHTHGRFGFLVQALFGEQDLTEFMAIFPY